MKLFLNCYVWGEGYITKCFDITSHAMTEGSQTMDAEEKTLFLKSNAKLLLAHVAKGHFGFVRGIESGKKDEQNRECRINIALESSGNEIDEIFFLAKEEVEKFSNLVRELVIYKGAEFDVDWAAFQKLLEASSSYKNRMQSTKPVVLVSTELSLEHFLKYSEMEWKMQDIECVVDFQTLRSSCKTADNLALYFYCPTPSMGWILRQIDSQDGSTIGNAALAGEKMSPISRIMLNTYGCQMALFQDKGRCCFLIKEVKEEKPNQYGQLKTVSFVVESKKNAKLIHQLAAFALYDFGAFQEQLLGCVKVMAGVTGYTVDPEKLQKLLADAGREKHVLKESRKKYSILQLNATLEYFNNSTGLDVAKADVEMLCENLDQASEQTSLEPVKKKPSASVKKSGYVKKPESMQICAAKEIQPAEPRDEDEETPIESINLLDYPEFKIAMVVLAIIVVLVIGFLIFHFCGPQNE